ncbi:MAG: hypothetical protein WC208_10565 [Gallionella sp.]|jgi:hypothetical protein
MTDATILPILKSRIQSLNVNIVDEDLTPQDTSYLRYNSLNTLWQTTPQERIRAIVAGVETYLFPAQYTVSAANGYVILSVARAATDIVRADYTFFPFSDAELTSIIASARSQIGNLIFRPITEPYNITYQEAIIKKCYTICIRKLQFPTIKYFSLSVDGRTISKENQVTQCNVLIEGNEKELLQDINVLRYYNKDNILT